MLHFVAYDIANPHRLRRIAKCCESFGVRIEKSVFESRLGSDRFKAFWAQLCEIADLEEDSLIDIPVCGSCEAAIQTAGQTVRPESHEVYVL